jgi:light-regulated signal transduction histidine kinase (bacteriophytochrome)
VPWSIAPRGDGNSAQLEVQDRRIGISTAHRDRISVEAAAGQGSTFQVNLPLEGPDAKGTT